MLQGKKSYSPKCLMSDLVINYTWNDAPMKSAHQFGIRSEREKKQTESYSCIRKLFVHGDRSYQKAPGSVPWTQQFVTIPQKGSPNPIGKGGNKEDLHSPHSNLISGGQYRGRKRRRISTRRRRSSKWRAPLDLPVLFYLLSTLVFKLAWLNQAKSYWVNCYTMGSDPIR